MQNSLRVEKSRKSDYAQATLNMYRSEEILHLSPVEVIKRMYDLVIQFCKQRKHEKAQRVISELIVALDFSQGDLPVDLFHLYQYIKQCIREEKLEEAADLIRELRSAWIEAFNL